MVESGSRSRSACHLGKLFSYFIIEVELDGRFFFLRNCIFGADPTILLDFYSNLGSIVPLFPVEKNKKNILFRTLLFADRTSKACRRLGEEGGVRGPAIQYNPPTDFVRFTLFSSYFIAGLHVIH